MLKLLPNPRVFGAISIGCMIVVASVVSCGGDSGGSRPDGMAGSRAGAGTSGSTATGGSSSTAGTTSMAGSMATGGLAGTASLGCDEPVVPESATLTDFSDWDPLVGRWGTSPGIQGRIFSYAGTAQGSTGSASVTGDALHLTQMVVAGSYAGGGLSFDRCASAAAYKGISFQLSGDIGTCALELQAQTFSDKPRSQAGGCDGSCSFPVVRNIAMPTATPTTVTVDFADMTGGMPNSFMAEELVGLQWQTTVPPPPDGGIQESCNVSLTIDDIRFVN